MLPAPVEEAVRGIAEDRTSGASKLARLALDTMGLAIVDAKGRPDPKELAEVARRISEAQPAMAIVHNVAHLVARLVSEGLDPKAVLLETRTELDRARERIARTFLKVVPPHATIVTLSYSDNVLEAIKMAHGRGHVTALTFWSPAPSSRDAPWRTPSRTRGFRRRRSRIRRAQPSWRGSRAPSSARIASCGTEPWSTRSEPMASHVPRETARSRSTSPARH